MNLWRARYNVSCSTVCTFTNGNDSTGGEGRTGLPQSRVYSSLSLQRGLKDLCVLHSIAYQSHRPRHPYLHAICLICVCMDSSV